MLASGWGRKVELIRGGSSDLGGGEGSRDWGAQAIGGRQAIGGGGGGGLAQANCRGEGSKDGGAQAIGGRQAIGGWLKRIAGG